MITVEEVCWGEKLRENDDVVQGDSHAATGEGMPHIPRVTKEDHALFHVLVPLSDCGKEGIGHAPDAVSI